jgi:hypothetical protein
MVYSPSVVERGFEKRESRLLGASRVTIEGGYNG